MSAQLPSRSTAPSLWSTPAHSPHSAFNDAGTGTPSASSATAISAPEAPGRSAAADWGACPASQPATRRHASPTCRAAVSSVRGPTGPGPGSGGSPPSANSPYFTSAGTGATTGVTDPISTTPSGAYGGPYRFTTLRSTPPLPPVCVRYSVVNVSQPPRRGLSVSRRHNSATAAPASGPSSLNVSRTSSATSTVIAGR